MSDGKFRRDLAIATQRARALASSGRTAAARRMGELRQRQLMRSHALDIMGGIETEELAAIKRLARETFRELAALQVDPKRPGMVLCGYYEADDMALPWMKRRVKFVAVGRTHREIQEQIDLWRREG